MQLEDKIPTKFFCGLIKKRLLKAQFKELHVIKKNREGLNESVLIGKLKTQSFEALID